jgi:hypothetical protein
MTTILFAWRTATVPVYQVNTDLWCCKAQSEVRGGGNGSLASWRG